MSESAKTQGAHHIGLTIPNLAETKAFFTDVLGFAVVGERPSYPAAFVSDGTTMITLWQAEDPANAVPFNRKSVIGLHHLALKVADQKALAELAEILSHTDGVAVEFAPEALGETPLRDMMCTIPGGVRVEFIAAPA
jgi:catechol 2,3-dioxygenase-like lactoylglutathione lyase family enzyme